MSPSTASISPDGVSDRTETQRRAVSAAASGGSCRVLGGKAQRLLELQQAGFRVPPFLVNPIDLETALCELGAPLVVRSSATVEDGEMLSFAGQFCSVLNLRSAAEVAQAIDRCRRSGQAPAVAEYCRRNSINPAVIDVVPIVQRMLKPELAGVAFTVNPATGEERVVIEASTGLADELLSGRRAPLPASHPLLQKYAPEIERTTRAIARHFGAPQDVEFAIEEGTLYVLQSRPITRITFAPTLGEWTNADFRDGGVASTVCSPLMWSLYELAWDRSLKATLRELKLDQGDFVAARLFFGRPYWNLGAVKKCVAKLPGFVERDFDNDLSIEASYEGDGLRTPATPWRVLRAVPTLLATRRFFRRQQRFDHRFLNGGFETLMKDFEPIVGDIESKLRRLIDHGFLTTETNYFRTIFAASLAKLDLLTALRQTGHGARPEDWSLLAWLPPLRHMEPVRLVRSLPSRGDASLADIAGRFPHHYRQGLDIRFPRWSDERDSVVQMLRNLPRSSCGGADPRHLYQSALEAMRRRVPRWRRRSFERKLHQLRKFVWLREEMRDLSTQMYYSIRRHVLEIARRRDLGDDIFFMSFQEIIDDDRSNIERNREIYESYRYFKAPNEIGSRYAGSSHPDCEALEGLAASGGTALGKAFVARSVAEAAEMNPGQILLCPFTDPGWTPILSRARGVVTETGGLLSHAAVICREFGIPAVLGVRHVTRRIPPGQTVFVDGSHGTVQVKTLMD